MTQVPLSPSTSGLIPQVHVLTLIVLFLAATIGLGLGTRYYLSADLNLIHSILIAFLSINILICYWEVCLFFRRTRVEERAELWRQWQAETGGRPHVRFLTTKIPWSHVLSPNLWADVWATYARFDSSYANRSTYGFNVDVGNGFVTFIPTLLLYVALTIHFLPATVVGILGIMLFWQWTYMSSLYWVSFFVANRQSDLSTSDLCIFIWGMNLPWVACPLLGLYVSIQIVVDGNFNILL